MALIWLGMGSQVLPWSQAFNLSIRKMAVAEIGYVVSTMGKAFSPAAFSSLRPILSLHKGYYIPTSSDKYKTPLSPHCPTKKVQMPIFTPSLIPTTMSHCTASLPFHPPSFISLCLLHHASHSYHLACPVLRLTFLLCILGHTSLLFFCGCTSSLHPLPQFHSCFITKLNPLQKPSLNCPLKMSVYM